MRWIPVTPGEDLFLLVRDHILPALSPSRTVWHQLRELLSYAGGSDWFDDYIRGAVSIHVLRRLLRHWGDESEQTNDLLQEKMISRFITQEVFPGLGSALVTRLARLTVRAGRTSYQSISQALCKRVLGGATDIRCYLCAKPLDPVVPDGHESFLSLDHIWPSSLGGESVEENLIPACRVCQNDKADSPSWEWLNVHNLVWPRTPSDDARQRVTRVARIARHYLHVTAQCSTSRMTLKAGFLAVGPITLPVSFLTTGLPATFFTLGTLEG